MITSNPPLGLYIHLPWCEKKCPYCDFNSHQADTLPETDYVAALLNDLEQDLPLIWGRTIETLFIGGGTPSLFSGAAIDQLFSGLRALLVITPNAEITMEANPGSADSDKFRAYRETGVNRLSIGVQSFNDQHLQLLGRVHSQQQALQAFDVARQAGFDNINLDLMYGLPSQSTAQALEDLQLAIQLAPEHISHYQLTVEPNTAFHHQPPAHLPDDELAWDQQQASQTLLASAGYHQYEISAYSQAGKHCRHNMNYWQFGDYLGIGAGAHGKITLAGENRVLRRVRQRQPAAYLRNAGRDSISRETDLTRTDLSFEFMLNALRLTGGVRIEEFLANTGLALDFIRPELEKARARGLLSFDHKTICPSPRGLQYLNDLQALFLQPENAKKQAFFDTPIEIIHN